jgi:hypothetical protein
MLVKFFIFLSIVFAFSFAQINLSGTVLEKDSDKPVKGANVKLAGKNLTNTTDADGMFAITGTFVQTRRTARRMPLLRIPGNGGFLFEHEIDGDARIRIYDISGRRNEVVFSGPLAAGVWRISPPDIPPGVYVCAVTTAKETRSIRFVSSMTGFPNETGEFRKVGEFGQAANHYPVAKLSAAAIDSLVVTREGYSPTTVTLDTLVKSGLKIYLTPTTTASDDATIVPDPSWTCFMPDGIPPPQSGEAVFTITLQYSAIHDVGLTKFGYRRQFDISGGSVTGSKITGTVLTGGLDYELTLSTGSVELEQINILRAGTTPILMRNAGVAPAGAKNVRMVLDFEAANSSSYSWLNTGKFAATRIVDSTAKTIKLEVYDISKATLPEKRVEIKDPAGVPNQTWDCLKQTGSQGTTVFTENVTLGGSVYIGASKRGSRNIIPITGGKISGKVTGKILAGGADYQLGGLDARYTLAPDDGELIVVRNCGAGTLYPVFEARVEGPYNYLNENKYVSSPPGPGTGGVSITFYERK